MSRKRVAFTCIDGHANAEITEKKSRFICDLFYVEDEARAAEKLQEIKKTHYNARHHVSAMIIGPEKTLLRAQDDGEPQGSAGKPMLEVLIKSGLTNILAVVTRYFGGTLLGTGGLARAYAGAVIATLDIAPKIEYVPASIYKFNVEYKDYGKLQALAGEFGGALQGDFGERVEADVLVREELEDHFLKQVTEAFSGAQVFSKTGETYIRTPLK